MPSPLRVLLVDDDRILIAAYERSLGSLRPTWEIATATSGQAAIAMLERRAFEVLVTDLVMDGVDGLGLLQHAERHLPAMLRVVVSGSADPRALAETALLAKAHLIKPFPAEALVQRIESLLAPRTLLVHVVDDSDHDRGLTASRLAAALGDCRVETFADGAQFLAHLDRSPPPDLAVLDIAMPVVNGIEVLRTLQRTGGKSFPIIVFSSEGVTFEMPLCEKLGADACLFKPAAYRDFGLVAQVAAGLLRRRGLLR